ncbi:MAG: SH3 domain-containing protein [Anaerolineae bacterium]|nr:SH3 domain-containing protein [Anaerolineae bacterium]
MNRKGFISFFVLLGVILACVIPLGLSPTDVVITQIVVVPNEQQAQPAPTNPNSNAPAATDTIVPTQAVVSTATTVPTEPVSGPYITFVKDAICRSGPGTANSIVTAFEKGQTMKIVGRNPDHDKTWWKVGIPSGGECWISFSTGQDYWTLR